MASLRTFVFKPSSSLLNATRSVLSSSRSRVRPSSVALSSSISARLGASPLPLAGGAGLGDVPPSAFTPALGTPKFPLGDSSGLILLLSSSSASAGAAAAVPRCSIARTVADLSLSSLFSARTSSACVNSNCSTVASCCSRRRRSDSCDSRDCAQGRSVSE